MTQPNRCFTTTRYPENLESLDSLLNWLLVRNGPYPGRWYDSVLEGRQAGVNLLRSTNDFETLARLTNLDVRVLRKATLHRFAWRYYTPKELNRLRGARARDDYGSLLWEDKLARLYIRPTRKPQVCPRCWEENPVLLLPWCLWHVTTCGTHRVLLVDVCPSCANRLKIDFEKSCCAHCSTPIAKFPTQSIAGDSASRLLARLVWDGLGLRRHLSNRGLESLALHALYEAPKHPIAQMQPAFLLDFLWRLGVMLVAMDPHSPLFGPAGWQPKALRVYLYESTGDVLTNGGAGASALLQDTVHTHRILAGVCRLFLNWPDTWQSTLSRLASVEAARGTGWHRRFPVVLKDNFGTPEYSWLVDAWLDYMRGNIQTNPDLQPWAIYYRKAMVLKGDIAEVLSPSQAADVLGMNVTDVKEFVDRGLIEATQARMGAGRGRSVATSSDIGSAEKSPRQITLINIEALDRLNQDRASHLSLMAVAQRLGVRETLARDLIKVGLLRTDKKYNRRRHGVQQEDVEAFLARLAANSTPLHRDDNEPNLVTIERVVPMVTYYKLSGARILDAVMRGVLSAYRLPAAPGEDNGSEDTGLRSISDLRFKPDAVIAFAAAQPLTDGRELLSRDLVRRMLKCTHRTIVVFETLGLLVPVEQDRNNPTSLWLYDSRDVAEFRERYIGTVEAASILGCTPGTLRTLVGEDHIPSEYVAHAADGRYNRWLFDRYALKEWAVDRITVREAAEILGVQPQRVHIWAREGWLTCVSAIWFSRREVTEWRDDRISTKDAAVLIGVGLNRFSSMVKVGWLTPVVKKGRNNKWWLFSRRALTRWRAERMESKEVMATLNISRSQLGTWLTNGKLTRAEAAGSRKRMVWITRESVEAARSTLAG